MNPEAPNPIQVLQQLLQRQMQQAQQEAAMLQQMQMEIASMLHPQPDAPPEGAIGI